MAAQQNTIQRHARVVVIGGGIAGCSVLYHLAKLGWTDVVLVERGELTSGSTWHSVGNTPMFTASLNLLKILKNSNELYASLEAETGQSVGFHRVGSLRLATSNDLIAWYRRIEAIGELAGVENHLIPVKDALELNPFINPEGVLAVAHLQGDGYLDPSSVTLALAAGARQRGAVIYRGTRVEKISRTASGEWELETSGGPISAEIVVNAGGMWGRELGRMVGVELPLVPMEHQYIVTEAIPELKTLSREIPVTRDPERVFYMRQEGDGLLFGFFEPNPIPWATDGIPRDFGQQLLPERVDHLEPDLQRAMERIPVLANARIKKLVNGPDAYTPDGAPLVGPVPGVPNYYVIAGFSLFGIANAGGTGRALAEWIVHGVPGVDLWEYDSRRFGEYAVHKSYLVAKAIEAYAMDYVVHYPYHERPAGRPLKTTPIHDQLVGAGAVMCARHGWERPLWFAPQGVAPRDELTFGHPNWFPHVGQECRAVRERVGVLDQTSFGKFLVSGGGATAFLNRLCANDIDVPVGKIVVTQMLNPRGGIECDVTVARVGRDAYWVVTAAWTTSHDWGWIDAQWRASGAQGEGGVTLADITDQYAVLSVMGPHARDVLGALTDADLSNAAFPFMTFRDMQVGAAPVRAYRISYVGESGWELYLPLAYQRLVYQHLMEVGQKFGIVNFGYRALDSMRMEKGYRFWGLDMNALTTPLEAGLGQFVKWNKGDFNGREALVKQKSEGVTRTLECLVLEEGDAVPHGWEPVLAGGEFVSYVCSGEYGHTVGKTIFLAYLPHPLNAVGSRLTLLLGGERYPATVVRAPLFDPSNARLKGA